MRYSLLAAAVSSALFTARADAAHPLITEDTGTQGKGRYQLELFGERTRDEIPSLVVRATQATAVLSYGVADSADLQFGIPYQKQTEDDGIAQSSTRGRQDASIDVKWRFYEKDGFSLGFKPGITLPTGDEQKGLGSGSVTWGALLIGSYEPGPLAFHSHLGYRKYRNTVDSRESLVHVSGALAYKVTPDLKLVTDLSWDTNPSKTSNKAVRYVIVGAIWSVVPEFDLDIGWRRGYGESAIDRAFLLGAALRW